MSGSIATKHGDSGQTALIGGMRVSKADLRVEAYGTVDELNSVMGFARSICESESLRSLTKEIQKELFLVGSALSSPSEAKRRTEIQDSMVERLTQEVHRIEKLPGILSDWSIPGEHRAAAAYDVARTVCRRAERCAVRLREAGEEVQPSVIAYLNRLSDLLWLFGRELELEAGVDARLRDKEHHGPNFSRAW
jgi:cob(I)alamin adenosyltransferase